MKTQCKKLNTFTLSGLIIGPILGSGIVLLPPLLYDKIGNFSIITWAIILILGSIFALIFGKLAILYPGDGGVSLATKEALGKKYQLLTSFYLICAVFFGPVAVLLIAAKFLHSYLPNISIDLLSLYIYILIYILLKIRINFLGTIMLIATSIITILFLISSIYTLFTIEHFSLTIPNISIQEFGYSFVIVFWAIVGWEIIGNYSNEVKDSKTLTNAVIFSAIVIFLVYFLVALAICSEDFTKDEPFRLVWIIEPLFKSYSNIILTTVTVVLCIGAPILFLGGVARLVKSLQLTKYSSKVAKNGVPIGALNLIAIMNLLTLLLIHLKYLTLDNLVAFSDGFFIANAIIGLITAFVIFEKGILKYAAALLVLLFFIMLLFSNIYILITIFALLIFTYLKKTKK